jgi:hypothetical protein
MSVVDGFDALGVGVCERALYRLEGFPYCRGARDDQELRLLIAHAQVSKQNRQDGGSVNPHNADEIEDDRPDAGVDCLLERFGKQVARRVVKRAG